MPITNKEKVQFIIDAEDKAGAKFRKTRKELEETADATKKVGEKAKASTELAGTLAATLGGGAFGAAAGEIATITDRIGAMTEVAKTSKLAMAALRLSIVAAAGALALKMGKAIANYVSGAEAMKVKTAAALAAMKEADQYMQSRQSKDFDFKLQKIDLLGDPKKQEAAQKKLLATTQTNLQKIAEARQRAQDRFLELQGDVSIIGTQSDSHKQRIAEAQALFERYDLQAKALRDQKDRLESILGPEKELAQIREKQAAARVAQEQAIKRSIEAVTGALIQRAKAAEKERETRKAQEKFIKAGMESVTKSIIERTKQVRKEQEARDKLDKKRTQVEERIAEIKARMNERSGLGSVGGANAAIESRFSSGRAVQTDYAKVAADEAAKHSKFLAEQNKKLAEQNAILVEIRDKESALEVAR